MIPDHVHQKTALIDVVAVPVRGDAPPQFTQIGNRLSVFQRLVGGPIEIVRRDWPRMECGCRVVLVCNEEGLLRKLPPNPRLSPVLHSLPPLVGDVFLVGEGLVDSEEDGTEMDFLSITLDWVNRRGMR